MLRNVNSSRKSNFSECVIFSRWFSHKFEKNRNHRQLKAFYQFEKNTDFREFRLVLQTFRSWFFKKNQNFHSNSKEACRIWMNCNDRKNLQFSQKNDDQNLHFSSLRSNQVNHSENRFFELRQCRNVIAIRRSKSFAFNCFLQSKHDFSRMQLRNLWQEIANHYLFAVWSTDASNLKTLKNQSKFSSITRIWKSSWRRRN